MNIIPAIDLINAECVRLTKGDYDTKKVYQTDPLAQAKIFEDAGITHLHLVDLDGAKKGEVVNWKVLEVIATNTKLSIDFSGGIKTKEQAQKAFDCGAGAITIGSLAVKNRDEFSSWLPDFGDKIILGADVKNHHIATHGWLEADGPHIMDFIGSYLPLGIQQVMCTDISKDGMLQGPSIELYKSIIAKFPSIKLIASGGISNMADVYELKKIGCHAAIIGKAYYEGRIHIDEMVDFIK
ncbi:MAG: 1-(5-phosphoribosyl)-5-[(5-phosphoribosylamino)methylideneamino]imidazole-4-carboxamide isomerase [Chitinophagales bacterium]|nr:1-(5-phosphoribosyl)-5-[(5-phosphoribosylamino)methylideneamino]imidazole-4-carboxamide isomerase [Chitinophagales bacterium]